MNIAVLRETGDGESRVALMPESVQKLVESKASFSIESGGGLGAARTDDDYGAVGARGVKERDAWLGSADVLVVVSRAAAEGFGVCKWGWVRSLKLTTCARPRVNKCVRWAQLFSKSISAACRLRTKAAMRLSCQRRL